MTNIQLFDPKRIVSYSKHRKDGTYEYMLSDNYEEIYYHAKLSSCGLSAHAEKFSTENGCRKECQAAISSVNFYNMEYNISGTISAMNEYHSKEVKGGPWVHTSAFIGSDIRHGLSNFNIEMSCTPGPEKCVF